MSLKRGTIDSFFNPLPQAKRARVHSNDPTPALSEQSASESPGPSSNHATYPFPVPRLPSIITDGLGFVPASESRAINDRPDLDLLYYSPYVPSHIHKQLFEFLRQELFFYRVQYKIKRGPTEAHINTPRFTTVFGVDATSYFAPDNNEASKLQLHETSTSKPIATEKYKHQPRPLPHCLQKLREITEATTGQTFNFCLVNYYASGSDSISYHSDDERFLGPDPSIASLSLGAMRDFLLRHKPPAPPPDAESNKADAAEPCNTETKAHRQAVEAAAANPLKFPLASGDMILMRGRTQSHWLHSIPKRKGPAGEGGRINITFRKAMVKGGSENYYTYNVGSGPAFKWDAVAGEMKVWEQAV